MIFWNLFLLKKRPFFSIFFAIFLFFAIKMCILGYAILTLVYIVNINNKKHRVGYLFMTQEFFHGCVIVLRPHLETVPLYVNVIRLPNLKCGGAPKGFSASTSPIFNCNTPK